MRDCAYDMRRVDYFYKKFQDDYSLFGRIFHETSLCRGPKAYDKKEVPVGAVVVANQQIIARGHNLTELLHDVTAHAEMQIITAAAEHLGAKYLNGCTLYVTLEPCVMCAGALYWSQIDKIVFGARDEKRGAGRLKENLYHPKTVVMNGVMEKECAELLQSFFKEKRRK
jgi:tRNA(adenine34) deaminase